MAANKNIDDTTGAAHTPTAWGRSSRLGGGTGRLIGVSAIGGVIGAALVGGAAHLVSQWTGREQEYAFWMGALMALPGLVFGFMATWVLLVDRTTIRGAVRDPEHSIEGSWLEKAQSGAFQDTLILVALGAIAASLTGFELSLGTTTPVILVFMMASAAVRYFLQKARG